MDVPCEEVGKLIDGGGGGGMRVEMAMMVELEEVGKRELKEDVAQLVRPIHVPMKRLRRTDVVKREENYYDYYY